MTSPDAARSQVRGSTLLLAGQAFALVLTFATQVLLVRHLSKADYGAFAYALSIVAIGEAVSAFGMRRGVARFLPAFEERGDAARAAGTLLFAFATVVSLGLAVVLLVIGLRGTIAGDLGGAPVLLGILILLAPVQALENLLDGVFAVFSRPRAIVARKHVFSPLTRFTVVLLLVLAEQGVRFAAWGYVAAGAAGLLIYGSMLGRAVAGRGLLQPLLGRTARVPARTLLAFTVPLLSNDLVDAALTSAATVALGAIADAAEVADFRAVLPVSLTMTYVLSSFGLLFTPLAARLHERGERARLNELYWQTAAWSSLFALPVFLLAFAFAEPLVTLLFGERYEGAAPALAVLALGHFTTAALGANGTLLGVHGEVRYLLWTNLAAIALNVGLAIALIGPFGAVGAAVAVTATLLAVNGARQVAVARRTAVRALDRRFARLYALMAGAAAALLAAGAILDPPLVAGAAAVAACWVGLLVHARAQLDIESTFPELARLPLLRRLLGGGRA